MPNFLEKNKTVIAIIIAGLMMSSAISSLNHPVSVPDPNTTKNQSNIIEVKDSAEQPTPAGQEENKIAESYTDQTGLPSGNTARDSIVESTPNNQGSVSATVTPTPLISPSPQIDLYKVTKIVDGDTIAVDISGKVETLRLIGINTPETVDPRKPVECFGKEASDKAKAVLTGKSVRLEADSTQDERDKYGRLLRYVFLADGTSFNKMMISEGYAYEYTYSTPYKYQSEYKQAEKEAKGAGRGLWAAGVCDSQSSTVTATPTPVVSSTPTATPIITPATSINPTPSPISTSTPTPTLVPGQYNCSSNVYNCTDFATHIEAQAAYDACGGSANDIHRLDSDKDGLACESLS